MSEKFWWRSSLCAQVDHDSFFPPHGDPAHDAKAVCGLCKVRVACLADDLSRGEVCYGVYGGFGRDTRRALSRRVRAGESPYLVAAQAVAQDRPRRG